MDKKQKNKRDIDVNSTVMSICLAALTLPLCVMLWISIFEKVFS